jgi:hypothetical protein
MRTTNGCSRSRSAARVASRTNTASIGVGGPSTIASRDSRGAACVRSSTRLPTMSVAISVTPVTLPPGRASEAMKPAATASKLIGITIGIVAVARRATGDARHGSSACRPPL